MKYERSLIFEWIWEHVEWIFALPIASAVIIVGINVYMLFPVKQTVVCEAETVAVEKDEHQETLYMEETRFFDTEILLQELSQEEPTGGYLVTEEMAMLAQLVQAEAGNQDLTGKRLVADVVLNRVDSEKFPNTIEEVIYQKNPVQFGVTVDGAFDHVGGGNVSEECFEVARMELERESRLDKEVLYFNTEHENGKNPFKHGDHWFSY